MVRKLICSLSIFIFAHAAHAMEQATAHNVNQKAAEKLSEDDRQVAKSIIALHKDKDNNPALKRLIPACSDIITHPNSSVLYKCLANTTKEDEKKKTLVNGSILVFLITHGASLPLTTPDKVKKIAELITVAKLKITALHKLQGECTSTDKTEMQKLAMRKEKYLTIHGRLVKALEECSQSHKATHNELLALSHSLQVKTNAQPVTNPAQ